MKRTTVYISDRHDQYLRQFGKEFDIRPAETLRRALDEFIENHPINPIQDDYNKKSTD